MPDIIDFLKKSREYNLLEGELSRTIWILAVPMIIEMIMQSSFQLIDMFWVGKLGAEAIAAVSMSGIILMVMFSLAIGVSIATTALISRRVGEENFSEAGEVLVQAAFISLFIALVCGWVGWSRAAYFLKLLGAEGKVLSLGTGYLEVSFLGCGAVIFLFVINAAYRGAGHALEAMTFLIIANTINILVDPCLIFGWWVFPRLGIQGAAYGTIFSQLVAVGFQIFWLFKGRLKIVFERFRIRGKMLAVMLVISLPAAFQILLRIMATLVIMRLVSSYGTYAIAAYGVCLTLFRFILLPGFGLGNAASTLVGQNLGAAQAARAEKSAWLASKYNMMLMGMVAVIFFLFARPLIGIFNNHVEVIEIGITCLRYMAASFVFVGLGVVMSRALMGAGDTTSPTVINALTLWGFQLPLAWLLAQTSIGIEGIWIAITAANVAAAALTTAWFHRGDWKRKKI